MKNIFKSPESWVAYWDEGMAATQRGDFAIAFRKWAPLAEQGDPDAQNNLDRMYLGGQGTIPDNAYAHMWLNISRSNGNETAGELKELVEKKMTPSQIEKGTE